MIKRRFLFETLAELRLSEALKLKRAKNDEKKEEDAQKSLRESQSSQRFDTLHRLEVRVDVHFNRRNTRYADFVLCILY